MTDLAHPPLDENKIAIQRFPIYIPGSTSHIKFEPRYVLPMFVALWKLRDARKRDPADPVRILDVYPPGVNWKAAWLILDGEDAMNVEAARLHGLFGKHPRSGEYLFDVVYPGDAFETAFLKALEESKAGGRKIVASVQANPAIAELATIDGVGEKLAVKLYNRGLRSLRDVAMQDEAVLVDILGPTRATKAMEHVSKIYAKSEE